MEVVTQMQKSKSAERQTVRIRLESRTQNALPGGIVRATVTIAAGSEAVEASGVFIDLLDSEDIALKHFSAASLERLSLTHRAMNETFRIAPPFALGADETKIVEGKFQLPINFQPTFSGRFSKHEWQIRARVETLMGDADSDFQPFRVGAGF